MFKPISDCRKESGVWRYFYMMQQQIYCCSVECCQNVTSGKNATNLVLMCH